MSLPPKARFDPQFTLVEQGGRPSQSFRDYLSRLDALVAALAGGNLAGLVNAADDAAAAAANVQVGQMYRNGSQVMVRVV